MPPVFDVIATSAQFRKISILRTKFVFFSQRKQMAKEKNGFYLVFRMTVIRCHFRMCPTYFLCSKSIALHIVCTLQMAVIQRDI